MCSDTPKPPTQSELADLKAKAKAATQGKWSVGLLIAQEGEVGFVNAGRDCVARCDFGFTHLPAHANAAHIAAANPETILRLIDMIERRDGALKNLEEALIAGGSELMSNRQRLIDLVREALAATEPGR